MSDAIPALDEISSICSSDISTSFTSGSTCVEDSSSINNEHDDRLLLSDLHPEKSLAHLLV